MTKSELVPAFYKDMGEVLRKHGVACVVGMWFALDSDLYGFFEGHNMADFDSKRVAKIISEKLESWADSVYMGPTEGYAGQIICPPGDNN